MANQTKPPVIAWLFLVLLFALVPAPQGVRASNAQIAGVQRPLAIPEYFQKVAENQNFELYSDPATLAFKVVDRRSGYVWHSNLDEVTQEDRLNRTWTAFARSGISIDFLDSKAISNRASLTNAEQTTRYTPTPQGFEAVVRFTEPSITLKLVVRLEPAGVVVEVPFDSITEEDPDYKMGMLYLYPFFGATKLDSVPGYMFIPDGSGSLIRFSTSTKAKNMFYGKYYGGDIGMTSGLDFDPTIRRAFKLSYPVLGMVHGEKENAYIAIVSKGASYGQLHAHPAGIITQFNFLYNAFLYNESYFQATNRSGAGVTTLQPQTNRFDIQVHYRFMTGEEGDYVGMARSYQQYLVETGLLKKPSSHPKDIGIRLEFLGGEKEKILLWNRLVPMTTVSQMRDILTDLELKNPEVVYYGWQPLGASTMPPKSLKVDRGLGSTAQLRSFAEEVAAEGGRFYLYMDAQAALRDEKGYSPRYDLAMSITNFNLYGFNRGKVNFYLNFNALQDLYTSLSRDVFTELEAGMAVDSLGSTLYSDFKRGNFLNREAAIQAYQEMLADNPGLTAFYMPNDYMFGFTSAYLDIPLGSSGYIYTSDEVPFLQIALSGYIPYYGTALNFSSDIEDDLLRHVDFGVYPSFFLTHEATARILNTQSSWIYTSSYAQWGQEVERVYAWLNQLLSPVRGESIVARQFLAPGVSLTSYSNGLHILVNYNQTPFTVGNLTVNPKDARVLEVLP